MNSSPLQRTCEAARWGPFPYAILLAAALSAAPGVSPPVAAETKPPQAPGSAVQRTVIVELGKFDVLGAIVSPDRRHFATAVRKEKSSVLGMLLGGLGSGPTIVIDGGTGTPFHSNYRQTANTTYQVFLDSRASDSYPKVCAGCMVFSPDSKHLAYTVCRDEMLPAGAQYAKPCVTWSIVRDGELQAVYDDVGTPAFSQDGNHMAYVALQGNDLFLVLDGAPGPRFARTSEYMVTFSPKGDHVAFVAGMGDSACVVLDGLPGPRFPSIGSLTLGFSPDGSRLAYLASCDLSGETCTAVVDGQAGPIVDLVLPAWANPEGKGTRREDYSTGICFSADSRHFAYATSDSSSGFVVVDGQRGPMYEAVLPPRFRGQASQPTYAAKQAGKWFLVMDGVPDSARYDELQYNPKLTPPGDHWAYAVREGARWFMIVDGRRGPAVDELWVMDMVFSSDGARCAYPAREGKSEFLVLDGQPGPRWDAASSISFSQDGRHVAYVAGQGKKSFMLVDGAAGPMNYQILKDGGAFDAEGGAIEYFAVRDNTVLRIRQAVVPGGPGF